MRESSFNSVLLPDAVTTDHPEHFAVSHLNRQVAQGPDQLGLRGRPTTVGMAQSSQIAERRRSGARDRLAKVAGPTVGRADPVSLSQTLGMDHGVGHEGASGHVREDALGPAEEGHAAREDQDRHPERQAELGRGRGLVPSSAARKPAIAPAKGLSA